MTRTLVVMKHVYVIGLSELALEILIFLCSYYFFSKICLNNYPVVLGIRVLVGAFQQLPY